MNAKISVFFIWVEAMIYLLLCNLHDYTFKSEKDENSLNVCMFLSCHVRLLE